jgi:hypothetical protein
LPNIWGSSAISNPRRALSEFEKAHAVSGQRLFVSVRRICNVVCAVQASLAQSGWQTGLIDVNLIVIAGCLNTGKSGNLHVCDIIILKADSLAQLIDVERESRTGSCKRQGDCCDKSFDCFDISSS